jgi:hypothetical protein
MVIIEVDSFVLFNVGYAGTARQKQTGKSSYA